jgi:hypothetical protein
MAKPSLEQEILSRLRQLPRGKQRMVLDFTRFLVIQQINGGYDRYAEEAFDELLAASRQDVEQAGFTEADVPRMIEQVRAERTAGRALRKRGK